MSGLKILFFITSNSARQSASLFSHKSKNGLTQHFLLIFVDVQSESQTSESQTSERSFQLTFDIKGITGNGRHEKIKLIQNQINSFLDISHDELIA